MHAENVRLLGMGRETLNVMGRALKIESLQTLLSFKLFHIICIKTTAKLVRVLWLFIESLYWRSNTNYLYSTYLCML